MYFFITFYLVTGILLTLIDLKVFKHEGLKPDYKRYLYYFIIWFPELILELLNDWNDDDDLAL